MSRVRIPSPAPITTTPSHSGGCCCNCDSDDRFELLGKRVRLQAGNGRSMSESRRASGRRDFAFSVRRMSASGFIFAVRRAGVAGFVLPAMRAKYRGINMRTPLHPLFLTPSHSGGCCCNCDIDGGFELLGKRVRLQAGNGRSMSESRRASGRRDFAFSVRRMSASGFIFAVRRAGVAGFVLPAMRAKYRGINMRTPLHPLFLTPSHSGGGCCNCDSGKDNRRLFRYIDTKCVAALAAVLFSSGKSAAYCFVQRKNGIKTGNAKRSNRRAA